MFAPLEKGRRRKNSLLPNTSLRSKCYMRPFSDIRSKNQGESGEAYPENKGNYLVVDTYKG